MIEFPYAIDNNNYMKGTGVCVSIGILVLSLSLTKPVFGYSTNMDATTVIGQANFTSNQANQGGSVTANTLKKPLGVTTVGSKLVIVDQGNHRVLIYNSIPTTNNAAADVVIGQADMSGNAANRGGTAGANTLDTPYAVTSDGVRLLISDMQNDRVLVYNTVPTSNGASADVVIGQTTMTGSNYGLSRTRLAGPSGIHYDPGSGKLVITDNGNNRILIYNSIPTTSGAAADIVVGQADFDSDGTDATATTMSGPYDAKIIDNKLFVADNGNWRVLIYNTIPTTNGAAANLVVGQPNLNSDAWDGPSDTSTDFPTGVSYDGMRLFVSDWSPRVLIYNTLPTSNGASADIVIGQSNFTNEGNNNGGLGANTLNNSTLGVYAGNNLFVGDTDNNRVLVFVNDEPGFVVTDTPTGVEMVLSADPTVSVGTTELSGLQSVMLKDGSIPISDVTIDFDEDRDWSSVVADVDVTANKSVIYMAGGDTGVTGTHTLYIPSGGKSMLRICPDVTSLTEVTSSCIGGVDFTEPFPQTKTVGSDTVTVVMATIDAMEYFVAMGLTGTGGIAYDASRTIVSGSSSGPVHAPGCGKPSPLGVPDLFQIRTDRDSAEIFFTPVRDYTSEYVVAYGYTPDDIRFGVTENAADWRGVQSIGIQSLTPNTTYFVRVRAGNGCATGYWSEPLKFSANGETVHKYGAAEEQ